MLRPRGDRIVAKKVEAAHETAAGIVLPSGVGDDLQRATVLAVGPHEDVSDLNPGDVVVHAPYGGVLIPDETEGELLILRHSDVIAVVG